tara:strand:+ start:900 stop:1313 length:414 start_codon:yes stop_codon:yes gene_type:complete
MSLTPSDTSEKGTTPTPFSLRLTFDERAILEGAAGDRPLGAYIRERLLNGEEAPRKKSKKRKKQPLKDVKALSQVLAELGQSRIANNLNQLARASNTGSLPVTPDTERALMSACADVREMRNLLMRALGYPQSGGQP